MSFSKQFMSGAIHQYKGSHFFRSCGFSKMRGALYESYFVHPPTDIIEKPTHYELQSDIPGFTKDQIKIELRDSQTLDLKGVLPEQPLKESEEEQQSAEEFVSEWITRKRARRLLKKDYSPWWMKERTKKSSAWVFDNTEWPIERFRQSFSRSFYFPQPIDGDAIQAAYENGVLKVTVPKKESVKIKVN